MASGARWSLDHAHGIVLLEDHRPRPIGAEFDVAIEPYAQRRVLRHVDGGGDGVSFARELSGFPRTELHPRGIAFGQWATKGRWIDVDQNRLRTASLEAARSDRCQHRTEHIARLSIVLDRAHAGTLQAAAVSGFDDARITPEDVRKPAWGHMVVVTAFGIPMAVAGIQCPLSFEFERLDSVGFVGPIEREAIKGESEDRRMLLAIVRERGLHARRILVVVIDPGLLWMPAARVEPDFGVAFDGIHAAGFEGIEEDHTIEGHADRSHRQSRDAVGHLGFQRQSKREVLDADRVGVVAVGEDRGRVIGVALAFEDQVAFVVGDLQVGNAIAIGVLAMVRKQIDVTTGVEVVVDVRLGSRHEPLAADGLQVLRIGFGLGHGDACQQTACQCERTTHLSQGHRQSQEHRSPTWGEFQ